LHATNSLQKQYFGKIRLKSLRWQRVRGDAAALAGTNGEAAFQVGVQLCRCRIIPNQ